MWAFLKSVKPGFSVKNAIHSRVAGYEPPRHHFPLRASDLLSSNYEFCPREHAFIDLKVASKKAQFVGTAQRMTFNHGNFMEDKIRNEYLRDVAWGNWICDICSNVHPTFGKAPKVLCPKCGWGHMWKYREPRFDDPVSGVSGGVDLLMDTGDPKLMILEVKTMAPEAFKELVAPLAEHRARTNLYMMLAESSKLSHSDLVNTKQALILYVTKSYGFKDDTLKAAGIKDAGFSPFKEFTVPRNDEVVKTPLARAKVLTQWRKDKVGMPCGICPNGLTKRAQSCAAVSACFSGKYQSTLTWPELGKPKHPGKTVIE